MTESGPADPLGAIEVTVDVIMSIIFFLVHGIPYGFVTRKLGLRFSTGLLLAITPTFFSIVGTIFDLNSPKYGGVIVALAFAGLLAAFFQAVILFENLPSLIEVSKAAALLFRRTTLFPEVFPPEKSVILLLATTLSFPVFSPPIALIWLALSLGKPHLRGITLRTPCEPFVFRQTLLLVTVYGAGIALIVLINWYGLWLLGVAILASLALWNLWTYFRK